MFTFFFTRPPFLEILEILQDIIIFILPSNEIDSEAEKRRKNGFTFCDKII
jgi:hypothetical protein